MHHNPIPSIVLAAALGACAVQPELLNSERIQQHFGNYGIEILEQDDDTRRSNLFSVTNGGRVCRTYAVVEFSDPVRAELTAVHHSVIAGQSIGATFKAAGWNIHKQTVHIGTLRVPNSQHAIADLMQLDAATTLGLHVYRLMLEKNTQSIHYATIVETHHPAYLSEADLTELYAGDISVPLEASEVDALLGLVLD